MTDYSRWGSIGVLETQLAWAGARRRVGQAIHRRNSTMLLVTAAIGLAGVGGLAVGYLRYERLASVDATTMMRTASANADLQDALARLRDQLGASNQALSQAQNRVTALSDESSRLAASSEQAVTTKADRIAQLTHALELAQRELHLTEAQRVTLLARLSKAEADLAEGLARQQQQTQAGLDQWQKKIQQLTSERDKAANERDQLRARVTELEKHSAARQHQGAPVAAAQPEAAPTAVATAAPAAAAPVATVPSAAAPSAAAVTPAPSASPAAVAMAVPASAPPAAAPVAPAAPAATQVAVIRPAPSVAAGHGVVAQFERVLASAGVDVTHLFAQYGMRTGEGGPFIPAPRGTPPASTLTPEQQTALENLMRSLPLSPPLASYEIGSGFGMRGDPINGRSALHTGIDFLAPYESPVYATAPGVVTFSGYRDDYGKIVEIDHGHGIATRYAHLHHAVVSVGQRVTARMQIGYLGSTGRATGPHVHYEVVVNGEPQDPAKFLGLARLMPAATR